MIQLTPENEHNEQAELFRKLFETAAEGILLINQNGTITLANRRVERIFRYPSGTLTGQSIDVLVEESRRTVHSHHIRHYLNNPSHRPMGIGLELSGQCADGTLVPVEISLTYTTTANGHTVVMALVNEISKRREFEQQRELAAKLHMELEKAHELQSIQSNLVSLIARKFRDPLAVIQMSADTLRLHFNQLSSEERTAEFAQISEQIASLAEMLDDFLKLTRAHEGKHSPSLAYHNLGEFFARILDAFTSNDQLHTIELNASGDLSNVMVDIDMLEHIITEVVTNAVKFSPSGGSIKVTIERAVNEINISVRDEGIGIPIIDRGHLIQPFFRASNTQDIPGVGLGLVIARNYLRLHGGILRIDSQEGVGTTVNISLPIIRLTPPQELVTPS